MYHLYVTTDIYRICQIFVARFRIWGGSHSLPVAPGLCGFTEQEKQCGLESDCLHVLSYS